MDDFVLPRGLVIDPSAWPDPNTDGTTTLPSELTGKILGIFSYTRSYIESQLKKCKETAPTGTEQ